MRTTFDACRACDREVYSVGVQDGYTLYEHAAPKLSEGCSMTLYSWDIYVRSTVVAPPKPKKPTISRKPTMDWMKQTE